MSTASLPEEEYGRGRLRASYAAYNAAYGHRLDDGGDEQLRRARLDLLLALIQTGEPLTDELRQQALADATDVLDLTDPTGHMTDLQEPGPAFDDVPDGQVGLTREGDLAPTAKSEPCRAPAELRT